MQSRQSVADGTNFSMVWHFCRSARGPRFLARTASIPMKQTLHVRNLTGQVHLANRTFRLNHATMGIRGTGMDSAPVVIPAGETVTVSDYGEGPFRHCAWGGGIVLVLQSDIESRGTLVQTGEA